MGPQTQKLSTCLSRLEEILTQHDEQEWAERVRMSNREIRDQDFAGVERFLSLLGGMGSLNDVVFSDSGSTMKLRSALSDAYDLAMSIKRQQ
jgi:hypothetical protein